MAEPKAFKSSDGNGGHIVTYDDIRRRKETIVSGVIIASCSGLIVALISGIFLWGFNDRKDIINEVRMNRTEIREYINLAREYNNSQTDIINRNSQFLADKFKWTPCPPPLPKMKEPKKD
jgi:hypothetical protein